MIEHRSGEPSTPGAPDERALRDDVNIRVLTAWLAGFFGLLLLAMLVVAGIFRVLDAGEVAGPASDSVFAGRRILPPEPRLQVLPVDDLQALQQAEQKRLHGYGWVKKESGVVHVPIDRAIDLLLERGLPVRDDDR